MEAEAPTYPTELRGAEGLNTREADRDMIREATPLEVTASRGRIPQIGWLFK